MLNKYLKYKYKYIELKKQLAGSNKKYSSNFINDGNVYEGLWNSNIPLIIQAAQTNNIVLIEKLISDGENINVLDDTGKNAYFYACENNFINIAQLLIKHGADINITNERKQKCFIDTNDEKPEEIKSVGIKDQLYGDCFAHATSRNFIRTLQVLGIIKNKYKDQFYDFFYSIITNKYGCEGGSSYESCTYLLNFLRNNTNFFITGIEWFNNEHINISKIDWSDDEDRDNFIKEFNLIKNILYIINVNYVPTENKIYPTTEIIQMLNQKLQPIVNFKYSYDLKSIKWRKKSNLKPLIISKNDKLKKCTNSVSLHAVNLRKWTDDYVEFKNSWGSDIYNNGNFSVSDIRQLSCVYSNNIKSSIEIMCLMFDENMLPEEIKLNYLRITNLYKETINVSHNSVSKFYFDANGNNYEGDWQNNTKHGKGKMIYINGDVYDGAWQNDKKHDIFGRIKYHNGDNYIGAVANDVKHGHGRLRYANDDVYSGFWFNDKRHGKGTMTYANGDVYNGKWLNDETVK